MLKFMGIALLLMTTAAQAGSKVCIDSSKNLMTVTSHYFFYGNYARPEYTNPCVAEMNRMFNIGLRVKLKGTDAWRDVVFKVSGSIVSPDVATELIRAHQGSTLYNFVRIEKDGKSYISNHQLDGNSGLFKTDDNLGASGTCAHEFGHGLGIDHPTKDEFNGKGVPHLMAARGAIVERKYQYNPNAKPGRAGGTLNPVFRKLAPEEFSRADFGSLKFKRVSKNIVCAEQGATPKMYLEDNSMVDWWEY